jgi:GntR family transcriptional repressor for pyruvate dehydrogenase complex
MKIMLSDKFELEQPPRLPDRVAAILTGEIDKGNLRPGDKLPTEAALATQFRVSRAVIREALSQLKYEGLLDSRQGKGVIVLGNAGRRSFRLTEAEKLSDRDLAQLYELRAILESETAALAALRRSKKNLDVLRRCLEGMALAVERDDSGIFPDLEFHQAIARASGNQHVCDLMVFLNDKVSGVIGAARGHSRQHTGFSERVQREHEAIFQAIEARDPDKAKEAALIHLKNSAKRLGLSILADAH